MMYAKTYVLNIHKYYYDTMQKFIL